MEFGRSTNSKLKGASLLALRRGITEHVFTARLPAPPQRFSVFKDALLITAFETMPVSH